MDSQLYRNTNTSYDLHDLYHKEKDKRDFCDYLLLHYKNIDYHKYLENVIILQKFIDIFDQNMNNIKSAWNDIENSKNLKIKEIDLIAYTKRLSERSKSSSSIEEIWKEEDSNLSSPDVI